MILRSLENAGEAVAVIRQRFVEAGIDNPRLDARLLAAHVLEIDPVRLFSHPETPISTDQISQLEAFVERRLSHEPMARILGRREFWSLNFEVNESTLVPRPDSETLVACVLAGIDDQNANLRLLDLGTGSGCLLLALLSELPSATGLGIDLSAQAVRTAQSNAASLQLSDRAEFQTGDWFAGLGVEYEKQFDIIISNPPYIRAGEISSLEPDVADYDPLLALSGGQDGLHAYREIFSRIAGFIKDGGLIAFEIGMDQASAVKKLGEDAGLKTREIADDLAGRNRVVVFRSAK